MTIEALLISASCSLQNTNEMIESEICSIFQSAFTHRYTITLDKRELTRSTLAHADKTRTVRTKKHTTVESDKYC